jgi:hypothetical protein
MRVLDPDYWFYFIKACQDVSKRQLKNMPMYVCVSLPVRCSHLVITLGNIV